MHPTPPIHSVKHKVDSKGSCDNTWTVLTQDWHSIHSSPIKAQLRKILASVRLPTHCSSQQRPLVCWQKESYWPSSGISWVTHAILRNTKITGYPDFCWLYKTINYLLKHTYPPHPTYILQPNLWTGRQTSERKNKQLLFTEHLSARQSLRQFWTNSQPRHKKEVVQRKR